MDIPMGAQVLVNNKHRAVVKYVGPTKFADGIWYGLELEREIGKHEGTVLGETYFSAPKKRGTFVKRENLTVYDATTAAANSINSIGRIALAKKKVKQELSWKAFNVLDADDERSHLQRQTALQATPLAETLRRERPVASELELWERQAASLVIEPGYTGPHITFPLTVPQVMTMMAAFKDGRTTLHYKYALQLICAYRRYANSLPTLVEITVNKGERMTVCGDTHGQLQDLYSIYTINGVPSPTNRYLMNGDFVDRGQYGCEIIYTIMAWCLVYPGTLDGNKLIGGACMLNRGNHETHAQNMAGGFMREVIDKYSLDGLPVSGLPDGPVVGTPDARGEYVDRGMRIYDACQAAFDCMPLATLIAKESKRVFVVHGGLIGKAGVTLAQIQAIRRKKEIPYGYPSFEEKLFEDLMWSDPRPMQGTMNSDRGAGTFFGSDVTEHFCYTNRISLVVRSHEAMPEGYQFTHGEKGKERLVTIFSASRYCGRGTNKGAILQFDDSLSHSVRQFMAIALQDTQPSLTMPSERLPSNVIETYEALMPIDHEPTLSVGENGLPYMTPRDGSGASSPNDASTAGAALLPDRQPSQLGGAHGSFTPVAPPAPAANAAEAAKGFAIDAAAQTAQAEAVRRMLMERICLRKSDLYFFFSSADLKGSKDGCVSKMTWADGMRTVLDLELPWLSLCPMLAEAEVDGRINYSRFLDRYRIAMRESDLEWMEAITERVASRLFSACSNLEESFKSLDTDGSGVIEFDELEKGLMRLDLGLSKQQVYELMSAIDTDRDGRIQFSEFAQRFRLVFSRYTDESRAPASASSGAASMPLQLKRSGSAGAMISADGKVEPIPGSQSSTHLKLDPWAASALTKVGQALFKGDLGTNAPAVFSSIDTNGDGLLSEDEFVDALSKLRLGFTEVEQKRIMELVDANHSGQVNYLEFVTAFRVTDTKSPALGTQVATYTTTATPASSPADSAVASMVPQPGRVALSGQFSGASSSSSASSAAAGAGPDANEAAAAAANTGNGGNWQRGVVEKIVGVLFEYRVELGAAFSMFDTDRSGKISSKEFRVGLQALTSLTGSPLTDMQADELLRVLDTDGDGEIDWQEFVGAFKLVDMAAADEAPAGGAGSGSGDAGGNHTPGSHAAGSGAAVGGRSGSPTSTSGTRVVPLGAMGRMSSQKVVNPNINPGSRAF